MTLNRSITDREMNKFAEAQSTTVIKVASLGELDIPIGANKIEASYPSSTTEVYTYKQNTTVLKTVTVTYTNSSKSVLASVEWV